MYIITFKYKLLLVTIPIENLRNTFPVVVQWTETWCLTTQKNYACWKGFKPVMTVLRQFSFQYRILTFYMFILKMELLIANLLVELAAMPLIQVT